MELNGKSSHFSHQENKIWVYSSVFLSCVRSDMAATPERSPSLFFLSLLHDETESVMVHVDQSNPDFTHISDDINTKKIFLLLLFFFFLLKTLSPGPRLAPV